MFIIIIFLTIVVSEVIFASVRFDQHRVQPRRFIMLRYNFLEPLRKALRFYAGFGVTVLALQLVGLLMYFFNVWPRVQGTVSTGVTLFAGLAAVSVLVRSCLWVRIYWSGAKALSYLRQEEESPNIGGRLAPIFTTLTRLLVASCILDLIFVPVIFMNDVLQPFPVSWWWLGFIDLSILLFPQAFGVAALILAFLTHQFAHLLRERGRMKEELELTI
jgi:hypothetical protein